MTSGTAEKLIPTAGSAAGQRLRDRQPEALRAVGDVQVGGVVQRDHLLAGRLPGRWAPVSMTRCWNHGGNLESWSSRLPPWSATAQWMTRSTFGMAWNTGSSEASMSLYPLARHVPVRPQQPRPALEVLRVFGGAGEERPAVGLASQEVIADPQR